MFDIKTDIGNFGDWKSLYLEMKYTDTKEVTAKCSYCFNEISSIKLTIKDVELLASDKLLDEDLIKIIEGFVKAAKNLL
nr:hypothetical protein [uncultured Romboutsia sp.]